jgi:Pam16
VIIQLATIVGRVLGRSVMDAYRETIARHGPSSASDRIHSSSSTSSSTSSQLQVSKQMGMSLDEAAKILNVDVAAPKELVHKVKLNLLFLTLPIYLIFCRNLKNCFN